MRSIINKRKISSPYHLNTDFARIPEWYNHWCKTMNPNKTKALVVSRSRTVNPPHGDLVLSLVSICAGPNLDILGMKFDSRLTSEDNVRGIVPCVSQRIYILRLVKQVIMDTSVLVRCYYAFVLPILEFSGVGVCCWMSSLASWASSVFSGQDLPSKFVGTHFVWNLIMSPFFFPTNCTCRHLAVNHNLFLKYNYVLLCEVINVIF